jgi:uncharacterized protein YecT (DUF1311 family)
MRFLLALVLAFYFLNGQSQTQNEMNGAASTAYEKADKELNVLYKEIVAAYRSDTIFLKNLKTSQKIWISFRDAELKMKFPERPGRFYGSIHPVCVSGYLEKLTRERIRTLKEWLDGAIEGEACNGSVKFFK